MARPSLSSHTIPRCWRDLLTGLRSCTRARLLKTISPQTFFGTRFIVTHYYSSGSPRNHFSAIGIGGRSSSALLHQRAISPDMTANVVSPSAEPLLRVRELRKHYAPHGNFGRK